MPILIIEIVASLSCDRVEYYPDKPVVFDKTYLLAHKGGGDSDEGNTLEGSLFGLSQLDGIEVDIQTSSENTLWLSHSPLLPSCGSFEEDCFVSHTDAEIIDIDSCLGNNINYTNLESVFQYMSSNYPGKFISLDAKAWTPCGISGINLIRTMNLFAQAIIDLTLQYHLENRVMVESENGDFLYYIKMNSDFIETYLTSFGDFELAVSRALDAGFSGISFAFKVKEEITKEQVGLIHRKGLKIQLWTVNDSSEISEAKSMNPDFIQTDNLHYFAASTSLPNAMHSGLFRLSYSFIPGNDCIWVRTSGSISPNVTLPRKTFDGTLLTPQIPAR
jgi:glycerophosphoryl diester phosphodiesterase